MTDTKLPDRLSPEEATRLVMVPKGPPHSEVVARVGPDVAWNAAAMRFERIRVDDDVTPTELLEAGVAETVTPKAPPARPSARR